MNKPKAIVVLSGGQDSATTLFLAQRECEVVSAIHFQYGQKHAVEERCAVQIARIAGVPLHHSTIAALGEFADSALIAGASQTDVNLSHRKLSHLPASFVPGRNLVFLTLAAAFALKMDAAKIYTGVCQEDDAGYPDCRERTLWSLEETIRAGMDFDDVEIVTPLMNLSKAQTFDLAQSLGVLHTIVEHTHTCYNGDHDTRNDWGYGCGACPACQTRANGWVQFEAAQHQSGREGA